MLPGEEEDIRERTREVERSRAKGAGDGMWKCDGSRGAVEKKKPGEESRGQKESEPQLCIESAGRKARTLQPEKLKNN